MERCSMQASNRGRCGTRAPITSRRHVNVANSRCPTVAVLFEVSRSRPFQQDWLAISRQHVGGAVGVEPRD